VLLSNSGAIRVTRSAPKLPINLSSAPIAGEVRQAIKPAAKASITLNMDARADLDRSGTYVRIGGENRENQRSSQRRDGSIASVWPCRLSRPLFPIADIRSTCAEQPSRSRQVATCHDGSLTLRGHAGYSETKEPRWMLPRQVNPEEFIFGEECVKEGELRIVASPLDVVVMHENGAGQAIAFLTETASPLQAEMFAALLSTKKCEWVP
jgi:hypothetical protein